ncbi:MAG: hypothetical protein M1815_005789 [Lichina confinis]|nr:MAG: hypothetical protein M1815_005789 [Lichina confinis]
MADSSANAHLTRGLVNLSFDTSSASEQVRAATRRVVDRRTSLQRSGPILVGITPIVFHQILIDGIRGWFADPTSRPDLKCGRSCTAHYVVSILYIFQIALIKLSLLAFYRRLLPVTYPYRCALYLMAGVVGAFSIATGLASIFQCERVPEALTLHYPDSGARSSCGVDPFILQTTVGVFIGLALVFLIGAVGAVATALRIGAIIKIGRQEIAMATLSRWALTMSDIVCLSFVEINLGVMCANFPALAGLWNIVRRRYRSRRALSHRTDGRQQSCDVERPHRPGWNLTTTDVPEKKRAKARSVSQEQLGLELAASNLSESASAPTTSMSDYDDDSAGRFRP